MIECLSCGREYRPGTLFCSECGIYLVTGGALQTDPLPEGELPDSKANPWTTAPIEGFSATPPIPLRLKIASTDRELEAPSRTEVSVGRLDAEHDVFPDLDLGPNVKLADGISRRHCKIHRRGSIYLIEDVGSANGTFVNGQRLTSHLLHMIKDGDEIQLGRIKFDVIIQEQSET